MRWGATHAVNRGWLTVLLTSSVLLINLAQAAPDDPPAKKAPVQPTAYAPPADPGAGRATIDKTLKAATGDLVFSAPPRGSYEDEAATYLPITEFLSKVTGRNIVFKYSDNWLSYSKEMTAGRYDIVFDGPAFNGWRMQRLDHTPLMRLPEDFIFVVISRADNAQIKQLSDLAGRRVCAHAPPNLGTLTMLSQFENPARQPVIFETQGWDNSYKAMVDGKCVATVVPIKNLTKNDNGTTKVAKILYQHKALPNQALSVGPRIPTDMHAKIIQALLSDEGRRATANLRAVYAGKDLVPAARNDYVGLGSLLQSSLYYQ